MQKGEEACKEEPPGSQAIGLCGTRIVGSIVHGNIQDRMEWRKVARIYDYYTLHAVFRQLLEQSIQGEHIYNCDRQDSEVLTTVLRMRLDGAPAEILADIQSTLFDARPRLVLRLSKHSRLVSDNLVESFAFANDAQYTRIQTKLHNLAKSDLFAKKMSVKLTRLRRDWQGGKQYPRQKS